MKSLPKGKKCQWKPVKFDFHTHTNRSVNLETRIERILQKINLKCNSIQ